MSTKQNLDSAPAELYLRPIEGMARWLGARLTAATLGALSMVELPQEERSRMLNSQKDFYRRDRYVHPRLERDSFRLRVVGTSSPGALSYEQLCELPQADVACVAECAGNGNHLMGSAGLMGQAHWQGPRVMDALEACGGPGDARFFAFRGADSKGPLYPAYHYGLSLEELRESGAILALRHNGEVLTRARGFPVRLVAPGIYAQSYVKWLVAIEGLTERHKGIYNDVLYNNKRLEDGHWVKEQARWISLKSVLTRCLRVEGGWELVGWAWGAGLPIEKVLVTTDGGESWHESRLRRLRDVHELPDGADKHAWTEFRYLWPEPAKGRYRLACRAVAEGGQMQPFEEPEDVKGHYDQVRVKWRVVEVP